MQREQSGGCGPIILTVILIGLAPYLLQIIGFILFMLVAFIIGGGR